MDEKAASKADQRSSLVLKTLFSSFLVTRGQICSTGLRSGECAGQMPSLNMSTPLAFNHSLVDLDW